MSSPSKPDNAGDENVSMTELEHSFARVIQELVNDKSLEKFRIEYEKLHEALIASHEHNEALVKRASELNADILKNSKQIANIISITQQDQKTIGTLRSEFEKAWNIIDVSSEKEQKSRMIIVNLKIEIENLSKLVALERTQEKIIDNTPIQDVQDDISKIKAEIQKNTDLLTQLRNDIDNTKTEISSMMKSTKETAPEIEDTEKEIDEGKQTVLDLGQEISKIQNDTTEYQKVIKQQMDENERLKNEIQTKKSNIQEMKRLKVKLAEDYKNDEADRTYQIILLRRTQKMLESAQQKTNETLKIKDRLEKEIIEKEEMKRTLPEQIIVLDNELKELRHDDSELKRYKKELSQTKSEFRKAVLDNQQIMTNALVEINRSQLDIRKKRLDADAADKSVREIQNKIGTEILSNQYAEALSRSVQGDIVTQKAAIMADSGIADNIEKDINENINQTRENNHNIISVNQVKESNLQKVDELNIKLNDIQNETHQINTLKVAVHNDYVTLKRQVINEEKANDAIRSEFNTIKAQALQLKEEIRKLDDQGAREHLVYLNLQSELETMNAEKEHLEKITEESYKKVKDLEEEIENKIHIVGQGDIDISVLKTTNDKISSDIRMIKNGIAQNISEIQEHHSKITSLTNVLNQCKNSFEEIIDKIEENKEDLHKALVRRDKLNYKLKVCRALQEEYKRLFKELIYYQGLGAAIEQELSSPITVNKWVFLEHTDPEKANLLRFKYKLIDEISAAANKCNKLRLIEKNTRDKLNKAEKTLRRLHCNQYLDQIKELNQTLNDKQKELDKLEIKYENKSPDILQKQAEIDTIRDELRSEKMERNVIKKLLLTARASTANNRERFRPFKRRHRGDSVFVGGGFALPLNNSEALPLVKAPPQNNNRVIQSARNENYNLPRLNLKTATDSKRASAEDYEYAVRPPSSKPLVPRSSRRKKEYIVD